MIYKIATVHVRSIGNYYSLSIFYVGFGNLSQGRTLKCNMDVSSHNQNIGRHYRKRKLSLERGKESSITERRDSMFSTVVLDTDVREIQCNWW